MNFKQTKYKRTTSTTFEEYSAWDIRTGGGFTKLSKAIAKFIEKIVDLLYVIRLNNVIV